MPATLYKIYIPKMEKHQEIYSDVFCKLAPNISVGHKRGKTKI